MMGRLGDGFRGLCAESAWILDLRVAREDLIGILCLRILSLQNLFRTVSTKN